MGPSIVTYPRPLVRAPPVQAPREQLTPRVCMGPGRGQGKGGGCRSGSGGGGGGG